MKQSKTTLKELSSAYRAVLRHSILCNAIALGLISISANAATTHKYINNGYEDVLTVENMNSDVGVYLAQGSAADIKDASNFSNNNATYGGAIYNVGNMNVGGNFTENEAESWGGAIYNTGNLSVSDNTMFSNNKAGSVGGAIVNALGTSVLTLGSNVSFLNNEAVNDGGAIGNYKGATLVDGTVFTGNKAQTGESDVNAIGGGAMSLGAESTTQIANAVFNSNTSGFNGGAIGTRNALSANNSAAKLDITDSTFTGNKALGTTTSTFKNDTIALNGGNGGALDNHFYNSEAKDGYAYVADSHFINNEAINGGAIYNNGTEDSAGKIAKLDIENSDFADNTATYGGAIYNGGTMVVSGDSSFSNNSASTGGAVLNEGSLTIAGAKSNKIDFIGNHSDGVGAAILSRGTEKLDIDYANFSNNTADKAGGAISNLATSTMNINHSDFVANSVKGSQNGGAINNNGTVDSSVLNTTFSGNYTGRGNSSPSGSGGAIYNNSGAGSLTLKDDVFSANGKSGDGNYQTSKGGAIYNNSGTLDISGGSVTENVAKSGGAIYVQGGNLNIDGTSITDNISTDGGGVIYVGGGNGFSINNANINNNIGLKENAANFIADGLHTIPAGTTVAGNGGAIYNSVSGKTSFVSDSSISDNIAAEGGALYNNKGTVNIEKTTFANNVALKYGGAIRNLDSVNIKNTTFADNIAKDQGGAIYNNTGKTITLDGSNTFSGNKSNVVWDENDNITEYVANDIYNNNGTINIVSGVGDTNVFEGGIDGATGSKLNINGGGMVNMIGDLKKHTVKVNSGELWMSNGKEDGSNLADSTVAVADGATLNTMDNTINNYLGITLSEGANLKTDIDLANNQHDAFTANGDFNLTGLGITSDTDAETVTEFMLSDKAINVADGLKAYTTALRYDVSNSDTDGKIKVVASTAGSGGLSGAVNDTTTEVRDNVTYTLTDNDATVVSASEIKNADLIVRGEGTEAEHKSVTLNADLTVGDTSSLSIEKAKFTGSNAVVNKENATLNIKDSLMNVAINNRGVLISDPTTYSGTVDNSGTASFDDDTFADTSVLVNTGVVNLSNGVTFDKGATITGTGVTNLKNGTTHFNNTSNTNIIKVSSNADFDGTLSGGTINTQNTVIDNISGNVDSGELYVDANLQGNGSIDTFSDSAGSTIKNINLISSEYGNNESMILNIGGADVADDVQITGAMNYYTNVASDNLGNVVFSDKLVNTSGLYDKLGANWQNGRYIQNAANYTNNSDASHLTVGDALVALDGQVATNADNVSNLQNTVDNFDSANHEFTGNNSFINGVTLNGTTVNSVDTVSGVATGNNVLATDASVARDINTNAANALYNADNTYGNATIGKAISDNTTAINTINNSAVMNSGIDSTKVAQISTNTSAISAIQNALGNNTSGIIGDIAENTAQIAANVEHITANTNAINTLTGTGEGSVAKSITDNAVNATYVSGTDYVDNSIGKAISTNASAISELKNVLGDGQTSGVVVDVAANTAKISDNINAINTINDSAVMKSGIDSTKVAQIAANAEHITENTEKISENTTKIAEHSEQIASNAENIAANTEALSILNGTGEGSIANSISNSIAGLQSYSDRASALSLVQANAYTDDKVEKLDREVSAGIASAVALTAVSNTGVRKGEVAVSGGYGYYNGQSAGAFGAVMGLSNKWSVNAGAGISNSDMAFRAGTTYKFKLF